MKIKNYGWRPAHSWEDKVEDITNACIRRYSVKKDQDRVPIPAYSHIMDED